MPAPSMPRYRATWAADESVATRRTFAVSKKGFRSPPRPPDNKQMCVYQTRAGMPPTPCSRQVLNSVQNTRRENQA
jgi:hypothetical protein